MAILGSIIKTAIDLKNTLTPSIDDAGRAQIEQLKKLLAKATDTSLGIYYDFASIVASKDPIKAYQEEVPIHSYDIINHRWWQQQQKKLI